MNAHDLSLWLALILASVALVVAVAALLARSLFALTMLVAALGGIAAAALLALGAGDGALALALFATWAAVLLLATMLLSARAAKPARRGAPWISMIAVAAAASSLLFVIPDIGPAPAPASSVGMIGLGAWLAPLLLAAAAGCVGLLGYGERGAVERREGAPQ